MKAATRWPVGILAILGLTVAANLALYHVAGGDPSFAIEPNYYAKAVAWDSTLAQAAATRRSDGGVTPTLAASPSRDGARLSVALTDSTGKPVSGAVVKVVALYNARADACLRVHARADGDRLQHAPRRESRWAVGASVRREPRRRTTSRRRRASKRAPAGPGS